MKKIPLFLAVCALAVPAALFGAKADGPKAKAVAKYDTNKNGKLDPEEIVALKKDFDAAPKGELARFDTNQDGKLSDEEIAAIVPGANKKSDDKKGEKKGAKKSGEKKPDAGK